MTPFTWTEAVPFCAPALLHALGMPPTTPVTTTTLHAFFDPLVREYPWFDTSQRDAAQRFAALRDLIATTLTDHRVYRLGRIQITVIIAGTDATGAIVGLQTTQIET